MSSPKDTTRPALTAPPLSVEDAAEIRALLNITRAVRLRPDMPLGIKKPVTRPAG